ncbi:MAG: hypothetical protein EXS36_08095 [Pedosphaera sp.]|nr:hypothetical protein [Pedosphaera sp.]
MSNYFDRLPPILSKCLPANQCVQAQTNFFGSKITVERDGDDPVRHARGLRTSLWWLDYYPLFREHLKQRFQMAARDDFGVLFDLRHPAAERQAQRVGSAARRCVGRNSELAEFPH